MAILEQTSDVSWSAMQTTKHGIQAMHVRKLGQKKERLLGCSVGGLHTRERLDVGPSSLLIGP